MKLMIDGIDLIDATPHYHDGKLAALELAGRYLEPTDLIDHLLVTPPGDRDPLMIDWLNKKYYTRRELTGVSFKVILS